MFRGILQLHHPHSKIQSAALDACKKCGMLSVCTESRRKGERERERKREVERERE
jgi:hypothetical protein